MNATGDFHFDLGGLAAGQTHYFRAKAVGDGTSYGEERSFTAETTPPMVTTNDATSVTPTGAILNGDLSGLGTASSLDVSFEWGTTSGGPYPNETTPQQMNATGDFYFYLVGQVSRRSSFTPTNS